MPKHEDIPEEYNSFDNKWQKIAAKWFYEGVNGTNFIPKDGIDCSKALAHLGLVLSSYEPKHEHKMAAVAFLMDQWFEDYLTTGQGN